MTETTTKVKPGDWIENGMYFAGISPDTDRPMYTTEFDEPLTYSFNAAAECAEKLNWEKYLGHDD